jgi:cell wall-associated NlpC family hydrolase
MRWPVRLVLLLFVMAALSPVALCLGVAGWASGAGGQQLFGPAGGATALGSGPAPSPQAAAAVSWALAQLGTPYRWGGEGSGGFDCSGLVQAAFGAAGIRLPRVAQDQFDAGPPLPAGVPRQPGDLVFFGSSAQSIEHVGIVVSTTEMVDAPHTGAVVRVEPIFSNGYVGATRPAS